MVTFFYIIGITTALMCWFLVVLKIGKYTVGKDASFGMVMFFLLIAGPIGWSVLIIIAIAEIVDKSFPKFFNKK